MGGGRNHTRKERPWRALEQRGNHTDKRLDKGETRDGSIFDRETEKGRGRNGGRFLFLLPQLGFRWEKPPAGALRNAAYRRLYVRPDCRVEEGTRRWRSRHAPSSPSESRALQLDRSRFYEKHNENEQLRDNGTAGLANSRGLAETTRGEGVADLTAWTDWLRGPLGRRCPCRVCRCVYTHS
ncbi:hypothetical protein LY78DRAFT_131393 [Colletotrichum sublineola]|nr:hypothetical protein LY78DRAFT_131393 [Colletotrichum sublineola]